MWPAEGRSCSSFLMSETDKQILIKFGTGQAYSKRSRGNLIFIYQCNMKLNSISVDCLETDTSCRKLVHNRTGVDLIQFITSKADPARN
jgi:hypothetical protein